MTPEEAEKLNEKMAIERGDELAFPIDNSIPYHAGLTKREWMAIQIMSAMISAGATPEFAGREAIIATDKLLISLNTKR